MQTQFVAERMRKQSGCGLAQVTKSVLGTTSGLIERFCMSG